MWNVDALRRLSVVSGYTVQVSESVKTGTSTCRDAPGQHHMSLPSAQDEPFTHTRTHTQARAQTHTYSFVELRVYHGCQQTRTCTLLLVKLDYSGGRNGILSLQYDWFVASRNLYGGKNRPRSDIACRLVFRRILRFGGRIRPLFPPNS